MPNEDQGKIYAIIQTPPGTTLERTNDISARAAGASPRRSKASTRSPPSPATRSSPKAAVSNAGTCLINLKAWSERTRTVMQIIEELEEKAKDIGAVVEFFEPPAVPGYGAASGFRFVSWTRTTRRTTRTSIKVNKEFMDSSAQAQAIRN